MRDQQFDPRQHKVFAVDVRYHDVIYVVAGDHDQALDLTPKDDGMSAAYSVRQVTDPLAESRDEAVVGAGGWDRRRLTVNQALALIQDPPPGPRLPERVTKLTAQEDLGWLELARLHVESDRFGRVLRGVQASDERTVACDGCRLHLVRKALMKPGLWDMDSGDALKGAYPVYEHLLPRLPTWRMDVSAAWVTVQAALDSEPQERFQFHRSPVWLELGDAAGAFDAGYLADALVGAVAGDGRVTEALLAPGGLLGATGLVFPELNRQAVLMPVQMEGKRSVTDFRLAGCFEPFPAT